MAKLPAGSLDIVLGASYRDIDFNFQPDSGLQPGQVVGFNEQLPVSGALDYTDVFFEAVVPILRNVPGVKMLSATIGARSTDASKFGTDSSYKTTLEWSINDAVRVRGGVQSAIRSPSIADLFSPQTNNFPDITGADPCNVTTTPNIYRNNPDPAIRAQVIALCAAQSAVAGGASYSQPFGQARGITGGNPDLTPEKSTSFTLGVVLQPSRNFSATIDYWSIDLEEAIGAVGATTIVQRCFNRDGANPTFSLSNQWCNLFRRDAADGGIIALQQLSRNQSSITVSGVDIALDYTLNLQAAGQLRFNVNGTWTEKYDSQVTSLDPINNFAGSIGSTTGSATPEWRVNLGTTYSIGGLSLTLTNRYIDEMIHSNVVTGSSPVTNTGTAATWYHDISARYAITPNLAIRAGISNLTDQQPRLYSPNIQSNTDPSTFDVLGRRYFVGLNAKF